MTKCHFSQLAVIMNRFALFCHREKLNGFEAFPPFAAAVIVAQLLQAPQHRIDVLAAVFIALRVLHGVFYLTDLARWRSLVWFAGVGCVIALFAINA